MRMRICFVLTAALLLLGCERQSELLHIVRPENLQWETENIESGKIVRLHIFAQSENDNISRIELSEYDKQYGDNVIFDTIFDNASRKVDYWYNYQIPLFSDTTVIRFNSQVWTDKGKTLTYRLYLNVLPADYNIRSIDGITMYSVKSGKRYAFSLVDLNTIIPTDTVSDKLIFFDRVQQDSTKADVISREWKSLSGLYFSRFESFDYGEASVASIRKAYNICKHDNVIQNIKNDDVILFGSKADAYGVIKVLLVADDEGVDDDRYIFSVKTFFQMEK